YFPSRIITTTAPRPSSSSAQKPARCALCTGAFLDRRIHACLLTAPVFLVPAGGAGTHGGALGGGFPYLSPPIIQVPQIIPGHGSMGMRASSADTFLIMRTAVAAVTVLAIVLGEPSPARLAYCTFAPVLKRGPVAALLGYPIVEGNPCQVVWIVRREGDLEVDIQRELNEITAGSSTSSPPCGGSRPKWKEVSLPAHWDGSSTRELEAKRAEIDEILYGAAKEAPFSNIFIGGIGQAAGLAMHVSIFFPFELAGVIAINPQILLITADLLNMAKEKYDSIVADIWGPTKVFGYYTPRGPHVTSEPGLHAMDIPYAGSYGSRLQWAPYDPIGVAELMRDKFSQP
ncbi:hypothetical protein FOZ63_000868, partial [Perkinsus olseni]